MIKSNAEIAQFRCEKCNAPYPLGADDVIATCPYCGYTFEIGSEEVEHYIISNKFDKHSIIPFFKEWLKSVTPKTVGHGMIKHIDNIAPTLEWIPIFRITGSYTSQYSGYQRIDGGSNLLPINESSAGEMTEWILARRHAATYGINRFMGSLSNEEISQFKIDNTQDSPVLNSEISPHEAFLRFQKISKNQHRKAIDAEVLDHHFKIKPESIDYVHVPYWLVRYSYQKGAFRAAISGATGEVLFGELPVTKRYRFKKWLFVFAIMILNAVIIQLAPYVATYFGGEDGAEGATALLGVAMFITIGLTFLMKNTFLYEIEVDKEGNETREFLGDERVE